MEPTQTPATGKGKRWLRRVVNALIVLLAVLGTWHVVAPRSSPINRLVPRDELPAIPRAQRPITMDPAKFTGVVAEGYRIAKQRPELLEQLPCYCGCYLQDGHQNNLDCFRDHHGETCPMCLEIAREAARLEDQGYAADDIKRIIDRRFAPRKSLSPSD